MLQFVVLCLFSANLMHILAVPLPQYDYPPAIVCVPCCVPCGVVSDNNAAYSVGDVNPYYSNDVEPVADYPIVYAFDPNAVQTDPFWQPMVEAVEPVEPPSDTNSLPADENTDSVAVNVLDDPMETLVRSVLSEIAEKHGDSEADFTNARNDFMNRMADNNTT